MILLSFDTEEFDVPLENGVNIDIDRQVEISTEGTNRILDCLKANEVKATFFCTANFALRSKETMNRIIAEGHEVASHGYYHSSFRVEDLTESKKTLEQEFGISVNGYRQARMMPVSETEIQKAGYKYNSSINPTFIPGRYMNLNKPRTYFTQEGVLQIPASVTPLLRFPLFWLSCHNLPMWLYVWLCKRTVNHDGYLNVYFHPWEFCELNNYKELNIPYIIRNNSGYALLGRLNRLITSLKANGREFVTFTEFIKKNKLHNIQ